MWIPVGYDTQINEYWNTFERAGIWDVGVQRIVEISGPDAAAFMNLLTPRDISKVKPGQCRYVCLTNQNGSVINDPGCCASPTTASGYPPPTTTFT